MFWVIATHLGLNCRGDFMGRKELNNYVYIHTNRRSHGSTWFLLWRTLVMPVWHNMGNGKCWNSGARWLLSLFHIASFCSFYCKFPDHLSPEGDTDVGTRQKCNRHHRLPRNFHSGTDFYGIFNRQESIHLFCFFSNAINWPNIPPTKNYKL